MIEDNIKFFFYFFKYIKKFIFNYKNLIYFNNKLLMVKSFLIS